MKCFYCGREILEGEGTNYPLDRPYVNLKVHRACSKAIDLEFLQENYDRILEYIGASSVSNKKRKK